MRFLRRLFAFTFRHKYAVIGAKVDCGITCTHIKCSECGAEFIYPVLDFDMYKFFFHQQRGCKGKQPAPRGEGEADGV